MSQLKGQSFKAQLEQFKGKTVATIEKIVRDSIQDVLEGAQTTAVGVTAGGTRIPGRIPVVSGDLSKSLHSTVGGETTKGEASYVTSVAGYKIGEFMRFSWDMDYAFRVELGFVGTDSLGREYNQEGWHFVGKNVEKWSEHVERNARLAGD